MGNSQTQFDQLRLIRSPNIGPVSYRQLMVRFGGARAALEALPDLVRRGGGKQALLVDEEAIAQEIEFVQAMARVMFSWMMWTILICCPTWTMRRPSSV
jgi:DNA processing protein